MKSQVIWGAADFSSPNMIFSTAISIVGMILILSMQVYFIVVTVKLICPALPIVGFKLTDPAKRLILLPYVVIISGVFIPIDFVFYGIINTFRGQLELTVHDYDIVRGSMFNLRIANFIHFKGSDTEVDQFTLRDRVYSVGCTARYGAQIGDPGTCLPVSEGSPIAVAIRRHQDASMVTRPLRVWRLS